MLVIAGAVRMRPPLRARVAGPFQSTAPSLRVVAWPVPRPRLRDAFLLIRRRPAGSGTTNREIDRWPRSEPACRAIPSTEQRRRQPPPPRLARRDPAGATQRPQWVRWLWTSARRDQDETGL